MTDYQGKPAWHHDDDVNTKDDKQSWSDWRGYQTVYVKQKQVVDGVEIHLLPHVHRVHVLPWDVRGPERVRRHQG